MKKLLLIIFLFLTGCVRNEDFRSLCKYEIKSDNFDRHVNMEISYSDNVVKRAVITDRFTANNETGKDYLKVIKEASLEFVKRYDNIEVFKSVDNESIYELTYNMDVAKLSDEDLNHFKLKKKVRSFFNKMKRENIECEDLE